METATTVFRDAVNSLISFCCLGNNVFAFEFFAISYSCLLEWLGIWPRCKIWVGSVSNLKEQCPCKNKSVFSKTTVLEKKIIIEKIFYIWGTNWLSAFAAHTRSFFWFLVLCFAWGLLSETLVRIALRSIQMISHSFDTGVLKKTRLIILKVESWARRSSSFQSF